MHRKEIREGALKRRPQVAKENLEVIKLPQERENVPQSPEELVKLASQDRVQRRSAEETVAEVESAPREREQKRTAEAPVEDVSLVSQERVQQQIAEAQLTGKFPQERISERTQIVDEPVPQILGGSWSRRNECKTGVCSAQWSVPPGTSWR